jgi:hypothetical protein
MALQLSLDMSVTSGHQMLEGQNLSKEFTELEYFM